MFENYISKQHLLHAYGIEGEPRSTLKSLLSHVENALGVSVQGNPDIYVVDFTTVGVDEAHYLEDMARMKAFAGERKLFFITAQALTREAQNALLKLFEEPKAHTHFFLIMPTCEVLLPTLRSRLFLISSTRTASEESESAEHFMSASPKERLDLLKDIVDKKDKGAALSFLNALEVYVQSRLTQMSTAGVTPQDIVALKTLQQARSYLYDRAPSVKMLLEHVALSLPQKKYFEKKVA